jgi:exosome complex component RRP46
MINASTLAFLDSSSVPMCGIVAAVAVARNHQGFLIADPPDADLENSRGMGCFAFMLSDEIGSIGNCIWASWKSPTGAYNETEVFEAKELARQKADEIGKLMRATVAKKFGLDDEDGRRMIT